MTSLSAARPQFNVARSQLLGYPPRLGVTFPGAFRFSYTIAIGVIYFRSCRGFITKSKACFAILISPLLSHLPALDAALCGVHCLNNLLQGRFFSEIDLAKIAHDLDDNERVLMAEMGTDTKDFLKFMQVRGVYLVHSEC